MIRQTTSSEWLGNEAVKFQTVIVILTVAGVRLDV